MHEPIDLDGLATTRLDPLARQAMMDAWSHGGNPGSAHGAGERAADLVEYGRHNVADLVGASPAEIFFTSGATEADNLAITGIALAAIEQDDPRRTIIVSAIEHKAVSEPAIRLRKLGFNVVVAPVTRHGYIDLDALHALVGPTTLLVSVMAANNETGAVQPIGEVATLARAAGALIHTDAAQAVGKVEVDTAVWDVDYASISSHKMHGPMGVGALYVAAHAMRPRPLIVGGGQEQNLRSGTVPAPLVAGFGAAALGARKRLSDDGRRAERLLAIFLQQISVAGMAYHINTGSGERLPGSVSIYIQGVDAEQITQTLARQVFLSTGSACSSGLMMSSHVLAAMGLNSDQIAGTLRVYCDPFLTEEAVAFAGISITKAALRQLATGRAVQ